MYSQARTSSHMFLNHDHPLLQRYARDTMTRDVLFDQRVSSIMVLQTPIIVGPPMIFTMCGIRISGPISVLAVPSISSIPPLEPPLAHAQFNDSRTSAGLLHAAAQPCHDPHAGTPSPSSWLQAFVGNKARRQSSSDTPPSSRSA